MTNAKALDALEALIATQEPASGPWTPVTDYSFEAREAIEGKHPDLIVKAFNPARVWDVGCGFGHLVQLLRSRGVMADGIDTNETHADYYGDIAGREMDFPQRDLVICREVLEHLTLLGIRRAVTNLCALSLRFVYVTTRFCKEPTHFLDFDTSDELDPTHITMLNQDFLRLLFVLEGFTRRADLETILDWQHKGRCLVYERV